MSVGDPLHQSSRPGSMWTTTNAGEAIPGVAKPLTFTFWADATERGVRRTFYSFGALARRSQAEPPADARDRVLGAFFGRPALRVDFLAEMGDRMPGATGRQIADQIFSAEFPPAFESGSKPQYYPLVAARMPLAMLTTPRGMRRARARTQVLWETDIARSKHADTEAARAMFTEAWEQFTSNVYWAAIGLFGVVQPVYEQLTKLVESADVNDPALMSGYGAHEESALLADIWACSRRRLPFDQLVARYGYHGPNEGQMHSLMWREDPAPLHKLVESYAALDDSADPVGADAARVAARMRAERELLAKLPGRERAKARAVLALAPRCVPLRAVAKVAFLQSLDVGRAAARRLGVVLHEQGHLDNPADIWMLTAHEVAAGRWMAVNDLIAERQAAYERYLGYDLPNSWVGDPDPIVVSDPAAPLSDEESIKGIAASHGVVEGLVRVVLDPGEQDIEPGEILVARFTDPSWASILFLASALIMDVGGMLSHAAVVSRELGIPCVADTKIGTKGLNTGDRVRVDGTSGRVEILERAPRQPVLGNATP
jgi:pyruvate, water dikinase